VWICEYYSVKLRREVILPARCYWLGLWLDWARDVTAYVELPANPESPKEWVADFWVEFAGKEYLIDVPEEAKADIAASTNPWALLSDGFETIDADRGRITPRWMWARRALLLSLEQAHPYAVSARLKGGLKITCEKLLADWPETWQTIGDACVLPGTSQYVLQCAIFYLIQIGKLELDWARGLSLGTRLRKVEHASQG
jgi:hypothetical protein